MHSLEHEQHLRHVKHFRHGQHLSHEQFNQSNSMQCNSHPCLRQVLDAGCGSNYLFRLTRTGASDQPASSALGKLEIKWRGSLGEVGRLQTQQILGPPLPAKVISSQSFIAG